MKFRHLFAPHEVPGPEICSRGSFALISDVQETYSLLWNYIFRHLFTTLRSVHKSRQRKLSSDPGCSPIAKKLLWLGYHAPSISAAGWASTGWRGTGTYQ